MPGTTNRGKLRQLEWSFRNRARPANLYVAFVTAASVPGPTTNLFSQLTEISAGNGYTAGGIQLTPGTTDFDAVLQDDTNNLAEVQIRDLLLAASGGSIPASGDGISYAVLLDDASPASTREVLYYWDCRDGTNPRSIADGQNITWKDFQLQARET